MKKAESRRHPANLLISTIILFSFTAFLLLALKDMQPRSFMLAALVPLIFFTATVFIPRLFPADQLLLGMVNFLCVLGVLALYRMDAQQGLAQALNYGIGVLAMLLCIMLARSIKRWRLLVVLLAALSLVLMALPLIFGTERNGARAWVSIAGMGFQPSELVKVSLLIIEAYLLSRRKLLLAALFAGLCLILLMLQKDLGTALIYYAVTLILLFASTRSYFYLGLGFLGAAAGGVTGYLMFSHVKRRVRIWLDPWYDYSGAGYQVVQALIAMVNGGVWGTGLGLGNAYNIPAVTTDFVFSIILNEFGLVFGVCVVLIYLLLFLRGIGIALRSASRFNTLLALGSSALIAVQAFIIIGGNITLIPLTGVTLPFISYGGSSLLSSMCIMGLLQGVASVNADEVRMDQAIAGVEVGA
ncbi:MAG: FtsW/RodA/SpoVE family cell cycle protein [Christensenellales bacterium]